MVTRLDIQRITSARDRVLALAHIAALRSVDGVFSPAAITHLETELRLPPTGSVNRELTRLQTGGLVVRLEKGRWALTPEGEHLSVRMVGDVTQLGASVRSPSEGSLFGDARHAIIPPGFAPEGWRGPVQTLLSRYEFDHNVLLIARFPTRRSDPLWSIIAGAREVCRAHGLTLHLAGDENADAQLFNNVAGYMWACRFGLALFEAVGDPPKKPPGLNPNLLIEVGAMLMTGRRCAILRDRSVERMPSDLVGHIYHEASFADTDATLRLLHRVLVSDFGTRSCSLCASESNVGAGIGP